MQLQKNILKYLWVLNLTSEYYSTEFFQSFTRSSCCSFLCFNAVFRRVLCNVYAKFEQCHERALEMWLKFFIYYSSHSCAWNEKWKTTETQQLVLWFEQGILTRKCAALSLIIYVRMCSIVLLTYRTFSHRLCGDHIVYVWTTSICCLLNVTWVCFCSF